MLETLVPCMKDALGLKSYLETRRQSYTTDWVCAATSLTENRDMLREARLENNRTKTLHNAANSSKLRDGAGREGGGVSEEMRYLGRWRAEMSWSRLRGRTDV